MNITFSSVQELKLKIFMIMMNNFNLSAPTSIDFRVEQVYNQLEHNRKNLTNGALKNVMYKIIRKIVDLNSYMKHYEVNSDDYLLKADILFRYITDQKVFLNQLVDVLDKNHHDYDIMKYCALVLSSTEYILGNDNLDEPED